MYHVNRNTAYRITYKEAPSCIAKKLQYPTKLVCMHVLLHSSSTKANEFKCGLWIEKDERRVNAKSLLGVLSLGIVQGTTVNIIGDGGDETEAVDTLVALIESNFDE